MLTTKHKSLTELEQSHQALQDQIAEAMVHRAIDDLNIVVGALSFV